LGSVFFRVARVFFVTKLPSPWPSTGELKFWSAATWNWYWSAPGTGLQAKGGIASNDAPLPGSSGTGCVSAP
jgi:hypothetical protein